MVKVIPDFGSSDNMRTLTAKNIVISPNFLVWKFYGKIQFPHSFGRFGRNCAFPQNFHTRKLGEIKIFFLVTVTPIFGITLDIEQSS